MNRPLEVLLYCDQLQLATTDALYSYGRRYEPANVAVKQLNGFLPQIKNVLVLGAGLGSLIQILRAKGIDPHITLIDNDKVVLQLAMEYLESDPGRIEAVCSDAAKFMEQNTRKYDLVFVDIFNGMAVPDFVVTPHFLKRCSDSLAPGGRLAFNYITSITQDWEAVKHDFASVFPRHVIISKGINKVFVTQA